MVGIEFAEVADEPVVVVVLDILQGRLEKAVAVVGDFGRLVLGAERETEFFERAVLKLGHLFGG